MARDAFKISRESLRPPQQHRRDHSQSCQLAAMIVKHEPLNDIDYLLSQLTLTEKVSLLSGADEWHTQGIDRLGIGALKVCSVPSLPPDCSCQLSALSSD
jgi:hypothetical protein